MRHRRASTIIALLATCSCEALRPSAEGTTVTPVDRGPAIAVLETRDRPRIALVARAGDPAPAMAVAVAHDLGSEASVALAALVESRLASARLSGVTALPHGSGYHVVAIVTGASDAGTFVRAVRAGMLAPVEPNDPALPLILERSAALGTRRLASPAEAAVAACSGELGMPTGARVLSGSTAATKLERWRKAAHTAAATAFGAVADRQVLGAAADALASTPAWPSGVGATDPWPTADVMGRTASVDARARLSVALRVTDPSQALGATDALGAPDGALLNVLSSLDGAWTVTRISATARPRGACVRVDLTAGESTVDDAAAATAALFTSAEIRASVAATLRSPWTIENGVLETTDPRAAAAAASWNALSGKLEAGPNRMALSFAQPGGGALPDSALARALESVETLWSRDRLETRERVEAGQGQVWVLLASPCAVLSEGEVDAGAAALAVHATATTTHGVRVEPYVGDDGIGWIVHAAPRAPDDTPLGHATRVADALGRVATSPIDAGAFAGARLALGEDVGNDPGWRVALGALAPGQPSALSARGTATSIASATTSAAERARRAILRTEPRIAIIATADEAQARALALRLGQWIRPLGAAETCEKNRAILAAPGEYQVEVSGGDAGLARAIVAVTLPSGRTAEAEWTRYLMNRTGGWLERAIVATGLATSARAILLGGRHRAALAIEITSFPDQVAESIAQTRALLAELAKGASTPREVDDARTEWERVSAAQRFDPRERLIELWSDGATRARPDLPALRRLHSRAFGADRHVVVRALPKP